MEVMVQTATLALLAVPQPKVCLLQHQITHQRGLKRKVICKGMRRRRQERIQRRWPIVGREGIDLRVVYRECDLDGRGRGATCGGRRGSGRVGGIRLFLWWCSLPLSLSVGFISILLTTCSLSLILFFVFAVILSGEIPVAFLLEGVSEPLDEFCKCDLLSLCSGAKVPKAGVDGLDLDRSMAGQIG
jgi:hypothetical protein